MLAWRHGRPRPIRIMPWDLALAPGTIPLSKASIPARRERNFNYCNRCSKASVVESDELIAINMRFRSTSEIGHDAFQRGRSSTSCSSGFEEIVQHERYQRPRCFAKHPISRLLYSFHCSQRVTEKLRARLESRVETGWAALADSIPSSKALFELREIRMSFADAGMG